MIVDPRIRSDSRMPAPPAPQRKVNRSEVALLRTSSLADQGGHFTELSRRREIFFTTQPQRGILPSCQHQRESDDPRVTAGVFIVGNPWSRGPKITSFRVLGTRTLPRMMLNDGRHLAARDAMESSAAWKGSSWCFSRAAWTRRNRPRRVCTNESEEQSVLA